MLAMILILVLFSNEKCTKQGWASFVYPAISNIGNVGQMKPAQLTGNLLCNTVMVMVSPHWKRSFLRLHHAIDLYFFLLHLIYAGL